MSEDDNVASAAGDLEGQFVQYHLDNNLLLYMTRQAAIDAVQPRINFMIEGAAPRSGRERARTVWGERVSTLIYDQKRAHYSASSLLRDPDIPAGMEIGNIYKAWSCTDDFTILDELPFYVDYHASEVNVPRDPDSDMLIYPPSSYKWFGAEIRSSVLDYDNPNTLQTLRRVCGSLRQVMRIHKPMAQIGSGLHVHIGQQAGWTLLQLKKFATLWHLIEPSMYRLHRRDREQSNWCTTMTDQTSLARNIFHQDRNSIRYRPTTTGPMYLFYTNQISQYLPQIPTPLLEDYFTCIWQFDRINDLNDAMRSGTYRETCLRWRLSGEKISDASSTYRTQTMEFRMMQGTFDADHVWRWASVLERLVVFCRDSPPDVYKDAIENLLNQILPNSIGLNMDDMLWFDSRRTDGDYFAYPDPNGMVDWGDPFMVRGWGDTHIP
ncbi:hypothetical protein ONZ43_g4819 [Nemania bipapillata]|uniref:Uncharacterized protein n=1 Tax=Nemania bipapillata TaxID=110536 RepID=A0ACC2IHW1_9PEZI|nr:hypothetical protein ONZ43_g4819 [Nemania bipapillata]